MKSGDEGIGHDSAITDDRARPMIGAPVIIEMNELRRRLVRHFRGETVFISPDINRHEEISYAKISALVSQQYSTSMRLCTSKSGDISILSTTGDTQQQVIAREPTRRRDRSCSSRVESLVIESR